LEEDISIIHGLDQSGLIRINQTVHLLFLYLNSINLWLQAGVEFSDVHTLNLNLLDLALYLALFLPTTKTWTVRKQLSSVSVYHQYFIDHKFNI